MTETEYKKAWYDIFVNTPMDIQLVMKTLADNYTSVGTQKTYEDVIVFITKLKETFLPIYRNAYRKGFMDAQEIKIDLTIDDQKKIDPRPS